jgi:hypothetical protein
LAAKISLSKVDFEQFPLQFISPEDAGFITEKVTNMLSSLNILPKM